MSRQVLDVGNCGFDHSAIRSLLERQFDADVHQAATAKDALDKLQQSAFDLVLINRRFDLDGDDGLQLIRTIRATPEWEKVPVMLISNYPEYQQSAVEAGAAEGFGKAELGSPATLERIGRALENTASQ